MVVTLFITSYDVPFLINSRGTFKIFLVEKMMATVLSVLIVNRLAMTHAYNLCISTFAFSIRELIFLSFR